MKKSGQQQVSQLNLFSEPSVQKKVEPEKINRNYTVPIRQQLKLKKSKPIKQIQREFSLLLTSKLKLNQWEIYLLKLTIFIKNKVPFYRNTNKNIEIIFKYYGTGNIVNELTDNYNIKIRKKLQIEHDNFIIKDVIILKRLGYGIEE